MTPAIKLAYNLKLEFKVHEYTHEPSVSSYGLEASAKLGVPSEQVFKTLVVEQDNKQLAVALVPVERKLNLKLMAKAVGAKKVAMANPATVQTVTGYVLGGVSPLGQKRALTTVIDSSAKGLESIYFSAGKRGVEIELSPVTLCELVQGSFVAIAS